MVTGTVTNSFIDRVAPQKKHHTNERHLTVGGIPDLDFATEIVLPLFKSSEKYNFSASISVFSLSKSQIPIDYLH